MTAPSRGEIWWGELPDVGRRPFLILTRTQAIEVLNSVLAVPVTRTIRSIPTEVQLDRSDGLPEDCAASFDNLRVVPKANLVERLCVLDPMRMVEACAALRAATDC